MYNRDKKKKLQEQVQDHITKKVEIQSLVRDVINTTDTTCAKENFKLQMFHRQHSLKFT